MRGQQAGLGYVLESHQTLLRHLGGFFRCCSTSSCSYRHRKIPEGSLRMARPGSHPALLSTQHRCCCSYSRMAGCTAGHHYQHKPLLVHALLRWLSRCSAVERLRCCWWEVGTSCSGSRRCSRCCHCGPMTGRYYDGRPLLAFPRRGSAGRRHDRWNLVFLVAGGGVPRQAYSHRGACAADDVPQR